MTLTAPLTIFSATSVRAMESSMSMNILRHRNRSVASRIIDQWRVQQS